MARGARGGGGGDRRGAGPPGGSGGNRRPRLRAPLRGGQRELAGWGSERIRTALEGRGVAREHVDAVLAGEEIAVQLERAVRLISGRGMSCASERERERALGFLVRRGYSLELAYEAVREAERLSEAA
ncbi:MAG TPA: RecX family transcriptional regulator [Solirubrobacterales bacterium]